MLLKEILADANLLVPNSLNEEMKVRWLNQDQRQLYRDFGFPDKTFQFPVLSGVDQYPLPNDCSRERITNVTINGEEYEYETVDYLSTHHSWTLIGNEIRINPKPATNMEAVMNYRPRPVDMTVAMQDVSPEFPEDFHEILVFGVALRIARSQQNVDKAMELKNAYEMLVSDAKRRLRPSRGNRVKVRRSWK